MPISITTSKWFVADASESMPLASKAKKWSELKLKLFSILQVCSDRLRTKSGFIYELNSAFRSLVSPSPIAYKGGPKKWHRHQLEIRPPMPTFQFVQQCLKIALKSLNLFNFARKGYSKASDNFFFCHWLIFRFFFQIQFQSFLIRIFGARIQMRHFCFFLPLCNGFGQIVVRVGTRGALRSIPLF